LWIDADPDSFHFDANPDPDPTISFTGVGKFAIYIRTIKKRAAIFPSQAGFGKIANLACQFTLFYLSLQRHKCHNFQYSEQ
jgi:hypothetical protein